jgi:hypothetical protein
MSDTLSSPKLQSATFVWLAHLIAECKSLLADPTQASVDKQADPVAGRLYVAALGEVTRLLPELRPTLIAARDARAALYQAASRDGRGHDLREPGDRFMEAAESVAAQLPALEPRQPAPPADDKPPPGPAGAEARKMLIGWHQITSALKMKYDARGAIQSLNEHYGGPIVNRGAGTKPLVYYDDLVTWWNRLAVLQQDLSGQREGAWRTAAEQHNYGREGKAAPGVGGGVKKRRRDKGT